MLKKVNLETKIESWQQTTYRIHVRQNTMGYLAPALFGPQKPYSFYEDFIKNVIQEIPSVGHPHSGHDTITKSLPNTE